MQLSKVRKDHSDDLNRTDSGRKDEDFLKEFTKRACERSTSRSELVAGLYCLPSIRVQGDKFNPYYREFI